VPDRYEPLPGVAELPRWLWRRTGLGLRIAAGAALLVLAAAAVVLVPAISHSRQAREAGQRVAAAEDRAAAIRRQQADQRPHSGRSQRRARPEMLREASAAILADARHRVRAGALRGPILRAACEPFPRTVGGVPPERDPAKHAGRYQCLAVTAEIGRTQANEPGALGYPYRVLVHFDSGRYAFCKVSGRPDPVGNPAVTTPAACGG
jgi:hypothetical protein